MILVRCQKILSNFELVMNFGRFSQTTVDWSCDVPSYNHHVLCLMVKGIIYGRCFTNGTLNLSFCMIFFLKISNQICRDARKHHLACECVSSFLPNLRSFEEKCMKFGNFKWEMFLKPRCTHVITITPGP